MHLKLAQKSVFIFNIYSLVLKKGNKWKQINDKINKLHYSNVAYLGCL